MAFCKFCGNEIPDGTTCTCAGAQAAAQAANAAPAAAEAVNNYDPAFGGDNAGAPAADGGAKKIIPIIIAAVVAILVIICLCVGLSPKTHAKSALKKYVKADYNKKGAEKVISYMVPNDALKEYKNDNEDEYEEMIDSMNESTEDYLEDYKSIKLKDITGVKKLKNSALNGAELYFEILCCGKNFEYSDYLGYYYEAMLDEYPFDMDPEDVDIDVTKGYQIKYKVERKDEDGDKNTDKYTACVVKLKGDGWKVIPCSAEELQELGDVVDVIADAEKEAKKADKKDKD